MNNPVETDRTDNAAEQALLGAMIMDANAIPSAVEHLTPKDMFRPAHETIMALIIDEWEHGRPIDPVTLAGRLDDTGVLKQAGGAPYIHTLIQSTPVSANIEYYAKRLANLAALRRLDLAAKTIMQTVATTTDADEALEQAQQAVAGAGRTTSKTVLSLKDVFDTCDVIPDGEQEATGTLTPTGHVDLDQMLVGGLRGGQMVIVAARPGVGKALALDTPLPTPTGWTTMGEVKAGDQLIGADGNPTTITAATDILHGRPCYELEFSDGSTIIADAEHQWVTHTRKERRTKDYPGTRTTREIAATLRTNTKDRRLNHSINNAQPLTLDAQDLLIHPYALGVWLGDGHKNSACFTSPDGEIAQRVRESGYRVTSTGAYLRWSIRMPKMQRNRACNWCGEFSQSKYRESCMKCRGGLGTFLGRLRLEGVLGDKHIPQQYLRASEQQRRDLLAGLMDTDGTVTESGSCQIALTDKQLAADTYELIVGLGYRCSVSTKRVKGGTEETSTCYTMTFSTPHRIFTLARKHEAHKQRRKAKNTTRSCSRFITAVRPIESIPVRCVQVDNDDHMYLAGRSMIPTHNSTLSVDMARHTAIDRGKPAVVFSLEMSAAETAQRIVSAEGSIALKTLRSGRFDDKDAGNLFSTMERIENAPLYIDDAANLTMHEIRAKARTLNHKTGGLGLIVVDYLQLLTSGRRVESRQQEVSGFSRQLKLLAKELDVPVVAISQLNRGVEQRGDDATPRLSDLRESGSLEQDADIVVLIHRPDTQNPDHARAGEADLMVAKHRGGQIGTVTVANQLQFCRFTDTAGMFPTPTF